MAKQLSEKQMLLKAKEICGDIDFKYEIALKEFIYELENYRINYLKPKKDQLKEWLKQNNGISNFIIYLEKKTGHPWLFNKAMKLWDIYKTQLYLKTRNINRRSLIEKENIIEGKIICSHCQSIVGRREVEIDHLLSVSSGGSSKEENLQILCKKCNRRKNSKIWIII